MKVQVKEGQKGFIYGTLRREGVEFSLKPVEGHDGNGKKKSLSVDDQFTDVWMEKIEVKAKPGPKPKQKEATED